MCRVKGGTDADSLFSDEVYITKHRPTRMVPSACLPDWASQYLNLELVGMKCSTNRECLANQRRTRGCP